MKKIIFFVAILLLTGSLSAQQWTLELGNESKELKDKGNDTRHLFIGGDGDHFFLLRHNQKEDYDYLACYDYNLQELRRVKVDNGKNVTYLGGFLSGDIISLMVSVQEGITYQFFREQYDATTLQPIGDRSERYSITHKDSQKLQTGSRTCQSGEWTSMFYVIPNGNEAEARICLYDNELDEMWGMDVTLSSLDDYFVSDSGEIILAGFYPNDNEDGCTLEFTVLNGEREQTYTCTDITDSLYRLDIVKCKGDKIYCTGLLRGERQDDKDNWTSGFFSLVYDIKEKQLVNYEKRLFTKTDICRLCNVTDRSTLRVGSADKMSFAASRYDSQGALVAYERYYNLLVNGIYYQSELGGLLLIRIDDEGHIQASDVVRRQLLAYADMPGKAFTQMIEANGAIHLVTIDNPKNIDNDGTRVCKRADASQSKSDLLMLHFSRRGDIHRQYLKRPKGCTNLSTAKVLDNGEYLMLFSSSFASYAAKLRYRR